MLTLDSSAGRSRGRSNRAKPSLECLETRELLSSTETLLSAALEAEQGQTTTYNVQQLFQQSLSQHPLVETIERGRVAKLPMFYASYTGPKLLDLDVLGANARRFEGRSFVFTGYVLGTINASAQSFYVFGVNRGGASGPGPFPNRPGIYFDAEIIVATSPDGFEGEVQRFNSKGKPTTSSSLANNAVVFNGNSVRVYVSVGLLGSTVPKGTADLQNRYSYAFWAGAGVSPSDPTAIAGFAPEYMDTSIPAIGRPSS
jgi:hypothetical protein